MIIRALLFLPVFLALTCAPALGAQGPMPRYLRTALWEAQQAMEAGDAQQAGHILTDCDAEHPGAKPAVFHLMLGNALMETGRKEEAREVYARGLAQHPREADLALNLAVSEQQLGSHSRSAGHFALAHELRRPPDPDILFQAAAAHHLAGEDRQALTALRRLREAGELNDPGRLSLLVRTCINLSRWQEAEATLLRFLGERPAEAPYWKLLGQVRYQRGKYREAAAALEIAARTGQASSQDWLDLVDLYQFINAPLKAAEILERTAGANPGSGECRRIARLHAKALRYEQALAWLDRALAQSQQSDPHLADLHLEKAGILHRALRPQDAMAALDELLRVEPGHWRALMLKAGYAWEAAMWETARASLARAARDPDPDRAAEAQHALEPLEDLLQRSPASGPPQ